MPPPAQSSNSPKLNLIHLSSSESYGIEPYITQYIQSRSIASASYVRESLLAAIEDFPCSGRVSVYELNAWLDSRLELRSSYPQSLCVIDNAADQSIKAL